MTNRKTAPPSRSRQPGRRKGAPKTGGRQKGTPNRATVEAKEMASKIVDDPYYFRRLMARARAGALPPAVECMLWHYAKGKPKESVEFSGGLEVSTPDETLTDAAIKKLPRDVLDEMHALLSQAVELDKAARGLLTLGGQ